MTPSSAHIETVQAPTKAMLRDFLEGYVIRETLNDGPLSNVYHGKDRETGEEVALKVLKPNQKGILGTLLSNQVSLETVIMNACSPERSERYASVAELKAHLELAERTPF